MKAIDLTKSIIDYNIKKLYAGCLENAEKSETHAGFWTKLSEIYKNADAYLADFSKSPGKKIAFFISEKQARYLHALMRSEGLQAVEYLNVKMYPTNPVVHFSAYGGFVDKKKDTSRYILKLVATNC